MTTQPAKVSRKTALGIVRRLQRRRVRGLLGRRLRARFPAGPRAGRLRHRHLRPAGTDRAALQTHDCRRTQVRSDGRRGRRPPVPGRDVPGRGGLPGWPAPGTGRVRRRAGRRLAGGISRSTACSTILCRSSCTIGSAAKRTCAPGSFARSARRRNGLARTTCGCCGRCGLPRNWISPSTPETSPPSRPMRRRSRPSAPSACAMNCSSCSSRRTRRADWTYCAERLARTGAAGNRGHRYLRAIARLPSRRQRLQPSPADAAASAARSRPVAAVGRSVA